jgi:hypothetical protein
VTRDEVRERFQGIVQRAITKADAQIAAHFARIRGVIPPSSGMAAMQREAKRRRRLTSTPRRRREAR